MEGGFVLRFFEGCGRDRIVAGILLVEKKHEMRLGT